MIWWDGNIEEVSDDGYNCIGKGFHRWIDITLRSSNGQDELIYTWWIVRRLVCWAAKLSDEDLPPKEDQNHPSTISHLISQDVFWDGTLERQIKNI